MRNINNHNEYHKYKSTTGSSNTGHSGGSNYREEELKGISIGGKQIYDATKDSNGMIIFKCLLVTLLCIGGIAIPVIAEMGQLATIICIFAGLGLSILVLKNVK